MTEDFRRILAPDETSSYSMVGLTPSWLPHGKRFGLFATKNFRHGDFLLEYVGSRISGTEAQTRSKKYARSQRKLPRCYLYYFNYKGKQYCLDATRETRGLAKFANDASIRDYRCNAKMKLEVFGDYPRLCLFAIKDIMPGEEIRYDYGEERRLLFWRQKEEQGTRKPFTEDSDDDPFEVERDRREQATEEPSDKSDLTEQADEMRVHDVDGVLNHSTTYCDKGDYIRPSAETSNTTRDFSKQVDETSLHGEDGLFTHSTKTDNDNCDSFGPSTETPTPSIDFSKQVDETSIHGEDGIFTHSTETDNDNCDPLGPSTETPNPSIGNAFKYFSKQVDETSLHGEDGLFTHSTETDNDNCDPLGPSTETPNPSIEFSLQADGTSLHDEDVTEEDSVNGDSLGHSTETSNTTIDLSCHICHRVFKKKGALSTHYHSHGRTKDKPYKKPSRPCFYCGQNQTRLSRHLIGKHAEEALVREALTYPEKSKERQSLLEKIRKQGIYRHNEDQAALPEPVYMSERKGHAEVQCSKCKGFYGSRLFYRHKEICAADGTSVPTKLKTQIMKIGDGEFESNILSRFQNNAVGHICRSDPSLIFIGRSLYQKGKGKVGKDMEVRKSVMQDMRLLSRLYLYFQEYLPTSTTIEDMFEVKHFDHLERAIEALTKLEGRLKHGVKHSLKYLLHTAHEKLVGLYSRQEEEEKLKRLQLFKNVLKLHEHSLFADATYAININCQEKLRMPEQQAEEEDVERLQVHIKRIISNKCSEYNYIDKHEFVDLRDSLCSRLTLFNARRGGSPVD